MGLQQGQVELFIDSLPGLLISPSVPLSVPQQTWALDKMQMLRSQVVNWTAHYSVDSIKALLGLCVPNKAFMPSKGFEPN